MELIFVLVAVCPAVILAKHGLQGDCFLWKVFLVKFAEWFYGITLLNFLILYLQGMGNFDFSVFSVQFLAAYMLHSIAIIGFVQIAWGIKGKYADEKAAEEGGKYDR